MPSSLRTPAQIRVRKLYRFARSRRALGDADQRDCRLYVFRDARALDPFGAAPGQALAGAPARLYQLSAEQPQPWRRDDRPQNAGRLLQRSLSGNLRHDAFGPHTGHDGVRASGTPAQARTARRQRGGVLSPRVTARGPDYRTAERAVRIGEVLP